MSTISLVYEDRIAKGDLARDPAQSAAVACLENLREKLEQAVQPRGLFARKTRSPGGLYLWGGVGRGKSMLMDMFVGALPDIPARRVHFHEFMQEVHAGMNAARRAGKADALAPVADGLVGALRVLALDEMQINDIADAMIVGRLFQRLIDGGVTVITTSNRPPGDLYKNGLNRKLFEPFIALIEDHLQVYELQSAEDYRQSRIAGEKVYFAPNDGAALASVDHIWKTITRGRESTFDLTVQGRVLHVPRYRNGAARMAFGDLCEQPLGAADYLALADAVRVLIIEDVPALNPANFDAAKRFVILIDALYEARVKLIVSAAAEAEKLFTAGTGSFEFERTASRLREMQGEDWGKD